MNAHIYIRVSSEEQVEGYSLQAQERACKLYCELHEHSVLEIYADQGFSGTMPDRPAYTKLLASVQTGDIVIVHKLDRWGRNTTLVLASINEFNERGISFVSISEQIDFSTPIGKVLLTLIAAFSQFYVDNLKQETVKGNREKAAQGMWVGPVPFGYRKLDKGTIVPSDDASTIHEIYSLYADGHSYRDIVTILNKQGKTIYRWREKDRVDFSRESIRTILKNRAYIGFVSSGGIEYPGMHQPLVSSELFEYCREIAQERTRGAAQGARHNFTLTRYARCSSCGSKMWAHVGGGTYRTYAYICSRRQKHGTCNASQTKAELVEYQIAELVEMVAATSIADVLVWVWMEGEVFAITPTERYRRVVGLLDWVIREA